MAAAKATLEPEVAPENERLIRTYHPALSGAPIVYALEELSGKAIWAVLIERDVYIISETHAAGREIHVIPSVHYYADPLESMILRQIHIPRLMYPRRMLTAHDISTLRSFYLESVGIQIYISGHAVVLFRNMTDMKKAWKHGWPDDIGGLNVGYDILTMPDPFDVRGYLGLRIRDPTVAEAITTVTHGSVKLPKRRSAVHCLADWMLKMKERLSEFKPSRIISPTGVSAVTEWPDYGDALDGRPVFITASLNVCMNKAMVEGAEYIWLGASRELLSAVEDDK